MYELVGLVLVPTRNSLTLIGLTLRAFSAVAADCLPLCPGFVHEALPTRSPLKGTGPEVTLKVALTLAPGATESNVCDVWPVPGVTEGHPLGTATISFKP